MRSKLQDRKEMAGYFPILMQHHAIKMHGMELQIFGFVTPALDESGRCSSLHGSQLHGGDPLLATGQKDVRHREAVGKQ